MQVDKKVLLPLEIQNSSTLSNSIFNNKDYFSENNNQPSQNNKSDNDYDDDNNINQNNNVDNNFSPEIEDRTFRKISLSILPILWCMICFCYIDRSNLAYASLSMLEDLNLSCSLYGFGSGIFFLGYSLFQIPSNLILVRVGAPIWLGLIVSGWGVAASCFAAVRSGTGFVVMRFVLGVLEAGAFPGQWYYLTLFYPKDRIAVPFSITDTGMSFSQVIGAPLASGLLALDGQAGLRGWQWVFLVEGIPTVIIGIIIFFKLPKGPSQAKFLSYEEKQHVQQRTSLFLDDSTRKKQTETLSLFLRLFQRPNVWLLSFIHCLRNLASFGILFWLPIMTYSMIHEKNEEGGMGKECGQSKNENDGNYEMVMTVLLTAIPYSLAAFCTIFNGYHSQMIGENRLHIVIPYLIGGIAFTFFGVLKDVSVVLGFLVLILTVVGAQVPGPCLLKLLCANAEQEILAVALPVFNSIGQIGGFVGPFLIGLILDKTRSYTTATVILGLLLAFGGILAWFVNDPSI